MHNKSVTHFRSTLVYGLVKHFANEETLDTGGHIEALLSAAYAWCSRMLNCVIYAVAFDRGHTKFRLVLHHIDYWSLFSPLNIRTTKGSTANIGLRPVLSQPRS